jgi:hypothetical protein
VVDPLDGGVVLAPPAALPLLVPPDGELGLVVVPDAEPEAEPDGELGLVAEPEGEDAPEPGAARLSPVCSPQPASTLAPRAMEIATARAESLI